MTLSAAFLVGGNANPAPHHVAFGSTVDLALLSTDGATSIVWEIMGCSDPDEPIPTVTYAGSPYGRIASFVFPADSGDTLGRTFLVRCRVSNQILGADGLEQNDIQYAVIGAENSQGELPIVPGEKNYRHGTHGWAPEINRALNNSGGGGGGGGGGGWTDDGAVVRLTSSGDSVAIGTASLSGSEKLRVLGNSRFEQVAASSGAPKAFYISGAAHTALTVGAEIVDVDFALDRTVQHATGAVTTQRAVVVRAPTYGFVGSSTVTDAATFAITGAPAAGTNATLTNSYALWVQAGAVRLAALAAGVVISSATGVLSSLSGSALQVLRWNSAGTALEFANPGSSLSAPSNPADDGKVAVASGGNLTYSLISNVHVSSSAAIALTKLATIATDRLLGRDTTGTGSIEELTVSGGIEFTGSGGIQRSAISGDITIAAGSGTAAITADSIVDADVNTNAAIAFTKLAQIATDRLLGRDTTGTGTLEALTVSGGVEFTGSGGIQRSALTGDVTASAGSNTTAIAPGVIVDADVSSTAAIAFTKLATIATDRLLGRDTTGTGALEALTVGGGLEFTGSGGIQRSAISGDITIAAGSGTAAITALSIVDGDISTVAAIAVSKLATAPAASVVCRAGTTTGLHSDLASTNDGEVLVRVAGGLTWGFIDFQDSITGTVPLNQIESIAGLSVLGTPSSSTAAPSAITGTDGEVLRISGTTLDFGQIATAGIANNAVTLAKLATQAGLSVLANATNLTAVPTAVTAPSDGGVFMRSGSTLTFGTIVTGSLTDGSVTYAKLQDVSATDRLLGRDSLGSGDVEELTVSGGLEFTGSGGIQRSAITGDITMSAGSNTAAITGNSIVNADVNTNAAIALSKLATQAALSVVLNATNAVAVPTALAASSDNTVLMRSGTALTFGAITASHITDGSVTVAKLTASGTDGRVLVTTAGVATWGFALGNNTDAFTYNAASHTVQVAGTTRLSVTSSAINLGHTALQYLNTVSNPSFGVNSDATAGPFTGTTLTIYGQDTSGSVAGGAVVGGTVRVRGGNSTTGTGGVLDLRSGAGATSTQAGDFTMRIGSAIFFSMPGTSTVAGTGVMRLPHNVSALVGLDNAGSTNVSLVRWGTTTNTLILGTQTASYNTNLLGDAISISGVGNTTVSVNGNTELSISATTVDAQSNLIVTTGSVSAGNGPASLGHFRMANGNGSSDGVQARNGANTANLKALAARSDDFIVLGDDNSSAVLVGNSAVYLRPAATDRVQLTDTTFEWRVATVRFDVATVSPAIHQETDSTAGATGDQLTLAAQDMTGTGATVGGALLVRGGSGATGGAVDIRSGAGSSATTAGTLNLRIGSTVVATWAGTAPVAASGNLRLPSTGGAYLRNNGNTADITGFRTNSSDAMFVGENAASTTIGNSTSIVVIGGATVELGGGISNFRFDSTSVTPVITHETDATASATGDRLDIIAQVCSGTTSTGGELRLSSGTGTSADGDVTIRRGITTYAQWLSTGFTLNHNRIRFASTLTDPVIMINSSSTTAATGTSLEVAGQDMTGTGATVGGITYVRAGNSTNGTGGNLQLLAGSGSTASAAGSVIIKAGSTTIATHTYTGTTWNVQSNVNFFKWQFAGANSMAYDGAGVTFYASTSYIQVGGYGGAGIPITFNASGTASNVGLVTNNASELWFGGKNVVLLGLVDTVPSAASSDGIFMWVADNASDGKHGLVLRSPDGNMRIGNDGLTQLSISSRAISLGDSGLSNVALFDDEHSFGSEKGVLWIGPCDTPPTAAPGDGVSIYQSGASLTARSYYSGVGTWELVPAAADWGKAYFEASGSTSSTAAGQAVGSTSFSSLPSNCAGIVKMTIYCEQAGTPLGATHVTASFRKSGGTLTYYTSSCEGGAGSFMTGNASAGFSGANFLSVLTPNSATARTYKTLFDVTYFTT